MSAFINNRTFGRKRIWAAAGIVAAGVASASLAVAQAPLDPDGSGGGGPLPVLSTTCGPGLSSTVLTRNSASTTTSPGWQRLPGAVKSFDIPAGVASRCIKVLLTAETACGPTAAPDFCYVRAVIDGVPMNPDGQGNQAMDSEDPSASAHAYEWVKRVGPGPHTVEIEWRVLANGTPFYADDWTMDAQIYQ